MKNKLIKGMREIQSKYNAFFIDLWGVVHNGLQLNIEAIDVLEKLNNLNKRCVLISNAPRPAKNVEKFLLKLNMNKNLIKNIFTSGQAAINSLQKKIPMAKAFTIWGQKGTKVYLKILKKEERV